MYLSYFTAITEAYPFLGRGGHKVSSVFHSCSLHCNSCHPGDLFTVSASDEIADAHAILTVDKGSPGHPLMGGRIGEGGHSSGTFSL